MTQNTPPTVKPPNNMVLLPIDLARLFTVPRHRCNDLGWMWACMVYLGHTPRGRWGMWMGQMGPKDLGQNLG